MKKLYVLAAILGLTLLVPTHTLATDGYLYPATKNVTAGEVFTSKVYINSGSEKVSGVKVVLDVDVAKLKVKSVVVNSGVFGTVLAEKVEGNKVTMYGASLKPTNELKDGEIEVGTIIFEGVTNGIVNIGLDVGSEVAGPNIDSSLINWQSASYTVLTTNVATPIPTAIPTINGIDLVLNYKISLLNVNPNSAKCVVNPPLKIMLVSNGQSKTYVDVVPQTRETVNGKLVFGGTLNLTGFNEANNVSVFVTGPKHIQMKFGRNNQSSLFNQAVGELTLSKVNSPVYDFSAYPLIAGDVVANNSNTNQDGIINGVDFAYIKAKSLLHETVAEGGYLRGDLDGNCQVNSNDVNIMKISLQDKQEQLY